MSASIELRSLGRRLVGMLAPALLLICMGNPARAEDRWPDHPVTLVVPFAPGGGTDTGARLLAEQLSRRWGQSVVVENKAGAAGIVGADFVARARPDGYTLLVGNIGTQSINPSLYPRLPYAPDKAFLPISLIAELPLAMMVRADNPAHSVKAFIALAKSEPGQLMYSSSGAGGGPHLAAEMFKEASGTEIVHVPYKGGGPAVADLLAGQVQLTFMTAFEAAGQIRSGSLRALAVTSAQRVPALPEVPTLAESGLAGFDSISWIGLLAPAGTPSGLADRIAGDVGALLQQPALRDRLSALGAVPHAVPRQQFGAMIEQDRLRYHNLIQQHHITTD